MEDVSKYTYRVARTRKELKEAFELVFKEYYKKGYIPPGYRSKMRISLYNALPDTTTFVVLNEDKRVCATCTLIPDSPLGIPMDKIYKKEVDKIRIKNRKVAEVSQLATDSQLFPRKYFSMFNFDKLIFLFKLFRTVLQYSYKINLNDLCIAVNPRHQYLYKFINFKTIGGIKYYGSVNKAPAVALRLNLNTLEKEIKDKPGIYKIFFKDKTPEESFQNKVKFTLSDFEYFFIKKSDHFEKASKRELKYIQKVYPQFTLNDILKKIGREI